MKKSEWVYRELLYQSLEREEYRFTQLGIAKKLCISLNTVNNALKPLASMGAIVKQPMGFRLIDQKKLLLFWASKRNIGKDIAYKILTEMPLSQIERSMPSRVVFAAYSAYRFRFNDVPADYSEVYVYADEKTLKEINSRFPEKDGPPNLFVLKADEHLWQTAPTGTCSIANIFVDLWNLNTWYAKEFLQALDKRISKKIIW